MSEKLVPHRWSGWPGAWCLDCGQEDPGEACVASDEKGHDWERCTWPEHQQASCPSPGSSEHDPYKEREA